MNLRNNKGYVLTDVSVSIIILLIIVPVIMGIVYQISITQRTIETKTEAINIAVNAIEAAKGISVEELDEEKIIDVIKEDENKTYTITDDVEDSKKIILKTLDKKSEDKFSYQLSLSVEDFGVTSGESPNVVKTVNAVVKYRIKGEDKEIKLSTVVK